MAMPDLEQLNTEILSEFPDYTVKRKTDSFWMKVLDVLLRIVTFNQSNQFMTGFTTTIGHTVWVPSDWDMLTPRSKAMVLRHERVHMRQQSRIGRLKYLFLYSLWYLPVFLSWGRAEIEMEAYEESMRAAVEYGVDIQNPAFKNDIISHFVTANYGWMWPFRRKIETWYQNAVTAILTERQFKSPS